VFYSPTPAAWDSRDPGATAAGPARPEAGVVLAPATYSAGSVKLSEPASPRPSAGAVTLAGLASAARHAFSRGGLTALIVAAAGGGGDRRDAPHRLIAG
jgi:hypothetical protein